MAIKQDVVRLGQKGQNIASGILKEKKKKKLLLQKNRKINGATKYKPNNWFKFLLFT